MLQSYSDAHSMELAPNRQTDQQDILEDPETNLHRYAHLIFDKGVKNRILEKKPSYLTNSAGKNEFPPAEK